MGWHVQRSDVAVAEERKRVRGVITILHTNDLHNCLGMMPRLAALVARERKRDPNALLVDAGDTKLGGCIADLGVQLLSSLQYDAMTPGNGENRHAAYRTDLSRIGAPMVVANSSPDEWPLPIVPYLIREVSGLSLALIGLTTPVRRLPPDHPNQRLGGRDLPVEEPTMVAQRFVGQLRPDVDLVVVMSHLGLRRDVRLALDVPGIDLIIGGHSHHHLPSLLRIGNTRIAQAGVGATYLGVIVVEAGNVGFRFRGRLEPTWQHIAEDGAVKQATLAYLGERWPEALEVVSESHSSCWGDPYMENPWANFVTDSLREQADADVCLFKAMALVPALDRGPMTRWDLERCMPRPELREWAGVLGTDRVVRMRLSGEAIQSICEHSALNLPWDFAEKIPPRRCWLPNHLLQTSGLRCVFDLARPQGRRVVELSVGGRAVEPGRRYTVVSSGFLASGPHGFRWFREAVGREVLDPEHDMVASSLRAGKKLPELDGRLRFRRGGE